MNDERLTDMKALARRAVACRHWRWMPGMRADIRLARVVAVDEDGRACASKEGKAMFVDPEDYVYSVWLAAEWLDDMGDALPDLTDPATLGCLLEIYDQTRKRRICPDVVYTFAAVYGLTHQKTIEALVAALEAAP